MKVPVWSLSAILVLAACGGSGTSSPQPASQTANGNWAETAATPASGPVPPTFSFTMGQGQGSMMNFSNLQMMQTTGCFGPGSVMSSTGQMSSGMMGGGSMGPGTQITMDLWSNPDHTGNHLTMVMTMNAQMDGMTGTYTLTGVTPGCNSGSGTMNMGRR